MDGKAPPWRWTAWFLAGVLLWATDSARAQSPPADQNEKTGQTAAKDAPTGSKGRGANTTSGQAAETPKAQTSDAARTPPRREFSEAYRESLRRTVEKRRELRARRRMGSDTSAAPGAIVPWPMPPALIIRHTSEVHSEVGNFLDILRR
jgi:hypothetical protein